MARRVRTVAAALAATFSVACSPESPPSAPQDVPSLAKPASPYACTFTGSPSVSNTANSYFTTTEDRRTASNLISAMQAGFTAGGYAGARDAGFDLLAFTGRVSRGTAAGTPAAGEALVEQTIQCMFDVGAATGTGQAFNGWPTSEQFDFADALSFGAGGAFFVRGSDKDPASAPAVANDATRGSGQAGNVSGIAPPTQLTWAAIVSNRVLVYGEPISEGYDWKLIPRSTSFSPSATVALCPSATSSNGTTADMISQENVGVLGYINADYICDTAPADFASAMRAGPALAFVGRLSGYAARWLMPAPLEATAVALSTIGGSASGAKGDQFTVQTVGTVELTMTSSTNWGGPKRNIKANAGNSLGTVRVAVSTPPDPVGGITVELTATNNNGFTQVGEFRNGVCVPASPKTTAATVGQNGERAPTFVEWTDACVTKTGAVVVIANSRAEGRSGGLGTTSSPKLNVKP